MKWPMVRLGDVCEICTGKKDVNEGNVDGKYPFFTCAIQPNKANVYSFDCDAILIAGNGRVGYAQRYSGKFEAYQRTYVLKDFKGVDIDFIFCVLKSSLEEYAHKSVMGTTMPYIKIGVLTDYLVPLPPLAEQRRIVAELEKTMAATDKLIAAFTAMADKARVLFHSILFETFSSVKAAAVRLGDVCEFIGGGTPPKENTNYYNGTIPWATVRDMTCPVITKTDFCITQEAVEKSATNIIPKGSVVISTHVGLGKVCLLGQDTAINQDLKAIRHDNGIMTDYLFWWFNNIGKYIESKGTGSTVKGVKLSFIQGLLFPLPVLSEQRRIVAELDAAKARCEAVETKAREGIAKAELLRKAILKEAFE